MPSSPVGSSISPASNVAGAGEEPRTEQRRWLLQCAQQIWEKFSEQFLRLWTEEGRGDAYPATLFGPEAEGGPAALEVMGQMQWWGPVGLCALLWCVMCKQTLMSTAGQVTHVAPCSVHGLDLLPCYWFLFS